MEYALLIYGDFDSFHALTDAEKAPSYAQDERMHAEIVANGRTFSGVELEPPATATTVRHKAGDAVLTDGPFAEAAEQLGGFYLVQADDLDEALAYARHLGSTVEVRPVRGHGGSTP